MFKNKKSNGHESAKFIIKKRLYAEAEGRHGGVWKIAYADFMTAMMTFFLVMWLINSASKETITQLASYFNPVKLNDRSPPAKGIHDNRKSGADDEGAAPGKLEKNSGKTGGKPSSTQHQAEEENLLRNPFSALTQLASQAESSMAAAMSQANSGTLVAGGSSHDPFATDAIMNQSLNRMTGSAEQDGLQAGRAVAPAKAEAEPAQEEKRPNPKREPASGENQVAAAHLDKELARLVEALPQQFRPNVSTKATNEGVLISITDDMNFSMFKIASAEPSPQLVLVLERMGNLINKYPGEIVIRGHTDGRPFAGDRHGNWRLSVNRANMTYFMLLRGRVDETRFLALEGYADRSLKNKTDPRAPENRRIEILIKGAET
ncbi:MAG: flagellar motor protein MotB [Rhodomicrobium sp.]